jgi:signal peptidase
MNYKIIGLTILSSIVIMLFANTSVALDCSKCHTTDPGKSPIKAKDTIEISENTCLKCHSSAYPPTSIGYNTHLVHVGKYSAKVDFLSRHPDASKSINCGDCHKQIFDCKNCHVKGIPHIAPPPGDNCQGCHGQLDNLFQHPAINLKIHNIFGLNSTKDCTMCHNPDNMLSFKLASGDIVPMEDSYKLCQQCHGTLFNQWNDGSHFVNKQLPPQSDAASYDYGGTGTDQNWEDNWRRENTCANCHNPHNPSELYQLPAQNIEKVTNLPSASYMSILGIMVGIFGGVFVLMKYRYTQLSSKLQKPSWLRLSVPKISLPISISIEDPEKVKKVVSVHNGVEKSGKVDKIDNGMGNADKIETGGLVRKSEKLKSFNNIKPKKKKSSRKNIIFVSCIFLILGASYAIFGAFLPVFTVTSESMSPHIEKGDMIIYEEISRVNEIKVYNNETINNYTSLGNYGDVIIYKPFGGDGIPYVHRAMYYVEKGDEMWPGGPKAPFSGYITKGDNVVTNPEYDQQIRNSYLEPVKKEWIIGVARYRIPYLGYLRMWL